MEDASSRGKRETLICGHKPPTQAKAGIMEKRQEEAKHWKGTKGEKKKQAGRSKKTSGARTAGVSYIGMYCTYTSTRIGDDDHPPYPRTTR